MSRQSILSAIRANKPAFPAAPVYEQSASGFQVQDFSSSLKAAGGNVIECIASEADKIISDKFSYALDFTNETVRSKFSASVSLQELEKTEFAVFEGNFGVAENGAVWLEDKDLPVRILPFIVRHLILKLNASKIVPTMHEAYSQIRLNETGYGVFIAGPSKTADIEQSLVYGAHGAVELTVLLIRD
jgi:L-lactate dehydrogenase complex protein LldG